jgi:hypothetical protein
MNPWTVLLIGILLGWLIEYAVDWFFWRRKSTDEQIVADLQDQLQASEERAARLEAQLAEAKSDSETWQTRHDELETEIAAAEEAKKDEEFDHEEFRGSLKGKLAVLGVGAAAGAAIAESGNDEEAADESLPDEELEEATTDEPMDGESVDTEENVDATDESFEEISEMEETNDGGNESFVASADTNNEAESIEEVEPVVQASEHDEINPDADENKDVAENNVSDSAFDDKSSAESTDSPDGNAFDSGEGGQES